MNMDLTEVELRKLFEHFDQDQSGSINYEEFVQGVRDPLSARRLDLVHQAFNKIDRDGSGEVLPAEVVGAYNADKHPDVIAGKKTKDQVLREFLDTFDVGGEKDGKVTRNEFENYYTNIGANIPNDDYFELMIRNAWHISGGEGWCANSANKRVLITDTSGKQRVVEIEDDLGLDLITDDKEKNAEIMRRLKKQGVDVMGVGEPSQQKKTNPSFASSITFGGVGESAGKSRVGKPAPKGARKGAVAADHTDIHSSGLKVGVRGAKDDRGRGSSPLEASS